MTTLARIEQALINLYQLRDHLVLLSDVDTHPDVTDHSLALQGIELEVRGAIVALQGIGREVKR